LVNTIWPTRQEARRSASYCAIKRPIKKNVRQGDSIEITFENEIRADTTRATDRRACTRKKENNAVQGWFYYIMNLVLCGIDRRLSARASAASNG